MKRNQRFMKFSNPSVLASNRCFLWSCKNSLAKPSCSQRKFLSNPRHLSVRSCLLTGLVCCYTSVCGTHWWHAQALCRHQNDIFLLEKVLFLVFKVNLYFGVCEIKCFRLPFSGILTFLSFQSLASNFILLGEMFFFIVTCAYPLIMLCFLDCFVGI